MSIVFSIIVIVLAIMVLLMIHREAQKRKEYAITDDYDERQSVIRGKGYRVGFYVFMIEIFVVLMASIFEINLPIVDTALYTLLIFVPIGVFAVYCIMHDAYMSLYEDFRHKVILTAAIMIINVANTARTSLAGSLIENGKMTDVAISPLCALLFGAVLIALVIRHNEIKKEESDDEES